MLILNLKLSRIELGFLLVWHSAALLALGFVALPGVLLGLTGLFILLSLARVCLAARAASPQRLQSVTIAHQHCVLHFSREQITTELPTVKFCAEFLMLLKFSWQPDQIGARVRYRYLLLLPDSLQVDEDRRLRRYLRFDSPRLVI
jgi:hypothetical protein